MFPIHKVTQPAFHREQAATLSFKQLIFHKMQAKRLFASMLGYLLKVYAKGEH